MTNVFQCASCKQAFKEVEGSNIEAMIQVNKDFAQDFNSVSAYGGLHKVCEDCYKKHMNQGKNQNNYKSIKKRLKVIWSKLTKL